MRIPVLRSSKSTFWPDRCAGPDPAEGLGRRLAGAASFFRVVDSRHDGADSPGRASVRSRLTLQEYAAGGQHC